MATTNNFYGIIAGVGAGTGTFDQINTSMFIANAFSQADRSPSSLRRHTQWPSSHATQQTTNPP
jgi:hypothetical protein